MEPAPPGPLDELWELTPIERGRQFEIRLGGKADNVPVVDIWDGETLTSVKTLDLRTTTYREVRNLTSKVSRYLNKLAELEQVTDKRMQVTAEQIKGRQLILIVPNRVGTNHQLHALAELQDFAATLKITLRIHQF
jgi:hypothetical protein